MPQKKRKYDSASISRQKKKVRRTNKKSDNQASQEVYYKIKDIIDENATSYKIDWENNSETGESYSPSWQPKSYVTEQAVQAWNLRKSQRLKPTVTKPTLKEPRSRSARSGNSRRTEAAPKRSCRRFIDSSPSPTPATEEVFSTPPARHSSEIPESETESSGPEPVPTEVEVQLSEPTNLARSQYPIYIPPSSLTKSTSSPLRESSHSQTLGLSFAVDQPKVALGGGLVQSPEPSPSVSESTGLVRPNTSESAKPARSYLELFIHRSAKNTSPLQASASTEAPNSSYPSPSETGSDSKAKRNHPNRTHSVGSTVSTSELGEESEAFQTQIELVDNQSQSESTGDIQNTDDNLQRPTDHASNNIEATLPDLAQAVLLLESSAPTTYLGLTSHLSPLPQSTGDLHNSNLIGIPRNLALTDATDFAKPISVDMSQIPISSPFVEHRNQQPLVPESSLQVQESEVTAMPDVRLETQVSEMSSPLPAIHPHFRPEIERPTMTPPKPSLDVSPIKELPCPLLNRGEFIVPLPLPSRVQNQYGDTFLHSRVHVQRFMAGHTDPATLEKIYTLIYRLHNVTTHIDLENEATQSQYEVPAEDEAKWSSSSSSKFLFLENLVKGLREYNVRIAIVSRSPRVIYMLERFMIGLHINFSRTDNPEYTPRNNANGALVVNLVPLGTQPMPSIHHFVNLVVAFDPTFDANEPHIQALRTSSAHPDYLSPVIHPLVYCSPAHLERCIDCLPEFNSPIDRLKALIACIAQTQKDVGRLRDEDANPEAAAEEVVAFISAGGAAVHWTLPEIRPVKVDGLELIASSPDNDEPLNGDRTHSDHSTIRKRLPEDAEMDMGGIKRQRMTPEPEISHISDSVISSQNAQIAALRLEVEKKEGMLRETESALISARSALESAAAEKDARLTEQMKALDELQTRYEKCSRQYHQIKHERKDLEENLANVERSRDALRKSNEQLRETLKGLEEELQVTRDQLAASTVPEVAEFEALRAEIRSLKLDKEALARKADALRQDFDFTRQQYQTASSAAADASATITALEAENKKLQAKASGEAARLRQLNNRVETETALAHIKRLEAEVEELREQLRRKERGRGMTTRTGSVAPRSPRLGGGASPARASTSRAGSRAPGSRSGSPIRSFLGMRKGRGLIEHSL